MEEVQDRRKRIKYETYNDHLENAKRYNIPRIHPTQKPIATLRTLIELFTDVGDVVIDPCCGSGSTIRAAYELGRSAYGFEIKKEFYEKQKLLFENMKMQVSLENIEKIKADNTEIQLEMF